MIFPGLKKLGKEFGFKNNGTFIYGFINNTYIMFADGQNQKNVWFRFHTELDEKDKQKIESWEKKGYAKKVVFLEENSFDVEFFFMEYFIPFNIEKIKEVIEDITKYMSEKYPQLKIKCSGDNCFSNTELDIYEVNSVPLPMCTTCARRLVSSLERTYEEEKLQANNYIQGIIGAIIFSIPGILLTYFFFRLEKIAAASGFVYYYLAQKGYIWAKGKFNKIAVFILSIISLVYTALGILISYIIFIMKEVLKDPSLKGIPVIDVFRITLEVILKDIEVRKELLKNIYLPLFVCGICIIINTIQSLKSTGKIKVKKLNTRFTPDI